MFNLNPIFYKDFYKSSHIDQYPKGVTKVFSNWTPRYSYTADCKAVVHFGLQYFLLDTLIGAFNNHFFKVPKQEVSRQWKNFYKKTTGLDNRVDHIEALHDLQFLPIAIYAIPEGRSTKLGTPSLVITNTHPDFSWLPNFFETMLSFNLWKPCQSATTAQRFRRMFIAHALRSGEDDLTFVDYMGHDFSMRGMSELEDAIISGMGHLTSFKGTDTEAAIFAADYYYGAGLDCGTSVPATEHAVMCAGSKEGEFETFKRLITEVYPNGIVSIVSDTWDLWKVLTETVPALKDIILARDGKAVIRPDSGDPVKIICGDPDENRHAHEHSYKTLYHPSKYGVIALLAQAVGVTNRDGKGCLLNKMGAIYGDAINYERADAILTHLVERGYSPYNMVFGMGSFLYEFQTRDSSGFAMKQTAICMGSDEIIPIFKSAVTDSGGKMSHKGIPTVYWNEADRVYEVKQMSRVEDLDNCGFQKVFENSKLLVIENFATIRQRVRDEI